MFKTSIMIEIIEFSLMLPVAFSRLIVLLFFVGAMGIANDVFQCLRINSCLDMVVSGPIGLCGQFNFCHFQAR